MDTSISLNAYSHIYLPKRQIAWKVEQTDKFIKRENESYSSLNKLFYYPYAYILDYQLGIRPIQIPKVSVTARIKGNIVHQTAKELWGHDKLFDLPDKSLREAIKSKLNCKFRRN